MIRKKIRDLLYERELLKSFKTDLKSADIFRLESYMETYEAKTVDFGNSPIHNNIVGILDDEGNKFYPLFTDSVYLVKKKDHSERLTYDSLNKEDIGDLFILNIKNYDMSSLTNWQKSQYFVEYKRLKNKLSQKQKYIEKTKAKHK